MAKKKSSKKTSKVVKTKSIKKTKSTVKSKVVKKAVVKKTAAKKTSVKKAVAMKPAPKKAVVKTAAKKAPLKSPSTVSFKIGDVVPDFKAESTAGTFKLSDFKGQKVVLYFYPKDNTSGCTLEGHDFSNNLDKFKNKKAVVFGISRDSVKSHHGFIQKQSYKHNLISDENENVCQLFGVIKEKSMYGRSYLGVDRSTFIIDENGVLKAEWRGVKVNGHVEEVLAKL